MNQSRKTRIAHLAGPTATIQNTPPLVTSNKARAQHGLALLKDVDGATLRHDALRPQRLAAPAKVYVEQFSAHPLESDVAELYGLAAHIAAFACRQRCPVVRISFSQTFHYKRRPWLHYHRRLARFPLG